MLPLVGTNSKKGARLNGVLDGNHYFTNPATNSAQWQNFGSGVRQNIDKVIHPAGYINSYNATAWCIGHDGGEHTVSTSETN